MREQRNYKNNYVATTLIMLPITSICDSIEKFLAAYSEAKISERIISLGNKPSEFHNR